MSARIFCIIAVMFLASVQSSWAEEFQAIDTRSAFVELIDGRALTRFGIQLNVLQTGEIGGRAFGRDVTGDWSWSDGYFCRDLFFGARDLGPNCQLVRVYGGTLRFISDRGEGAYADFGLD